MSYHRRSSFPYTHQYERNVRIPGEIAAANHIRRLQHAYTHAYAHPLKRSDASQVGVAGLDANIDTQGGPPLSPRATIADGLEGYQVTGPGPGSPGSNPVPQVRSNRHKHPTFGARDDQRPRFQHPIQESSKLAPSSFEVDKTEAGTYSIVATTHPQIISALAFQHPQQHAYIPQHRDPVAFTISDPGSQYAASDDGDANPPLAVVTLETQPHFRQQYVSSNQQFSGPEQEFNPPPRTVPAAPPIHGLEPSCHPFYEHGQTQHGRAADQDPNQDFGACAGSFPSSPAGWLGHAGIQQSPHSAISSLAQQHRNHTQIQQAGALQPQPEPPLPGSGPPLQPRFHAVPHYDHHDLTFRHHQYPPKRTPSGSSDQSAPYMTDLHLLLSPDQPDDGVRPLQAGLGASRRSSQTSPDREDASPPKKRSNTQLLDGPDPDEISKKRIRGRPRVEPRDQTPADRRRTQIRLAQRAYRNRKEEALQTLEKKVDDLQKNNEEMSKAFMQLQDLAIKQGLLQSAPEFGRQLKATSEKFLALAKVNEEGPREDVSSPEQYPDGHNDEGSGDSSSHHQMRISSSSPEASSISGRPRPRHQQLAFGTAPLPGDDATNRTHPIQVPFGYQVSTPVALASTSAELNVAVAPQTALDAGPYQAGTSLGSLGSLGGAADLGSVLDPSLLSVLASGGPSVSPFSAVPPVPASYSYQERTFGRRLQRAALEQGLLVAKMESPPPHIYAAVFGFCLLFEPRESIIRRLTNCIRSNYDETLHNWRFPFFHLGGAGTFFDALVNDSTDYSGVPSTASASSPSGGSGTAPTSPGDSRPMGNLGMKEPYKPAQTAGFGMGPFDAHVEETRDLRVDSKMRITVPGFEGTFFDPDEIEFYLRQRGVYIPPAADFVTIDVDINDFATEATDGPAALSAADLIGSSKPSAAATTTTTMATTVGMVTTSLDAVVADPLPATLATGLPQFGGPPPNFDFGSTGVKDILLDVSPVASALTPSPMLSDNLDIDLNFSMMDSLGAFDPLAATKSTRRTVTVNVATLVDELVWRSVCLGRAPGVRPKDVNVAFWLAATPS